MPIAFIFGEFWLEAQLVDVLLFLRRGPRNLWTTGRLGAHGRRILRSLADLLVITASQTFNSKFRRGVPRYRDRKLQTLGAGAPQLRAKDRRLLRGEGTVFSSPRDQPAIPHSHGLHSRTRFAGTDCPTRRCQWVRFAARGMMMQAAAGSYDSRKDAPWTKRLASPPYSYYAAAEPLPSLLSTQPQLRCSPR